MIKKRIMAIALFSTIIGILPTTASGLAWGDFWRTTPVNNARSAATDNSVKVAAATNRDVESIIEAGFRYLGTPYKFGSDRDTTTTFDCSDFVRQAFLDGIGITLPSDSRKQGTYVRELHNDKVVTDWTKLKRGDLMFFMSYKGSHASDYANVSWSKETITHVGIYLGNGEILHTYSEESGGVRTNKITDGKWKERFLFGGSAIAE